MRILHLAYEDPAQPGSGGGSVRVREINRRLGERHEIVAIVAGYPDARPRVADGVRWVPLGLRSRSISRNRVSYLALLGAAIRRYPHDLLVEEFSAPCSTTFSPLFTARPVVASVQWLFAAEMRAKYGLPFDVVERTGLGLYHDFIAVSEWLGGTLRARRPDATVETIHNGVDPLAFAVDPAPPEHLLYVGRLENKQKGCDLLLESIARARAVLGDRLPPVLFVGDGPDRETLVRQTARLELADIVRFVGRVDGRAKYQLMASAYAVLMPSRWESFGMVAVEGMAVGAPVVAFDVGPLAEITGAGGARLVPPFDIDRFAHEIVLVVSAGANLTSERWSNRRWARRFDWDHIATQQEEHYLRATASARPRRSWRRVRAATREETQEVRRIAEQNVVAAGGKPR